MTMITSYDTLIDMIVERMDDSAMEAKAPGFIQAAEETFNRRLYSLDGEAATTASISNVTPTAALPSGYRGMISIRIGDYAPLKQLSPDDFQSKWHEATASLPQNWAIIDGDINFGPAPDTSYTANLVYTATLTALSSGNQTNWLLLAHPYAYLYAALIEAELDGWNTPQAAVYTARLEQMIAEINGYNARRRRGNLVETVAAEYF